MARAFTLASPIISGSVPDQRTRHAPDDSQKARPKEIPGTVPTRAPRRSSTVLMKCLCPRIKLTSSGFSILTSFSSTSFHLPFVLMGGSNLAYYLIGNRKRQTHSLNYHL